MSAEKTILCSGGTHVYLTGQPRCQCGQAANGYGLSGPLRPATSGVMSYPWPPGYRPPKPDPAPDVSLSQLRAALRAGASWLSADGKLAYTVRYGETLEAGWNEQAREFGAWLVRPEGLPENAVKL